MMTQGSPNGNMQSRYDAGEQLAKRRGIYGGHMNLRRNGTVKELTEWIAHYEKEVNEGRFCPIRGAKIIAHFEWAVANKKPR